MSRTGRPSLGIEVVTWHVRYFFYAIESLQKAGGLPSFNKRSELELLLRKLNLPVEVRGRFRQTKRKYGSRFPQHLKHTRKRTFSLAIALASAVHNLSYEWTKRKLSEAGFTLHVLDEEKRRDEAWQEAIETDPIMTLRTSGTEFFDGRKVWLDEWNYFDRSLAEKYDLTENDWPANRNPTRQTLRDAHLRFHRTLRRTARTQKAVNDAD
jgi:hypothetical protein